MPPAPAKREATLRLMDQMLRSTLLTVGGPFLILIVGPLCITTYSGLRACT